MLDEPEEVTASPGGAAIRARREPVRGEGPQRVSERPEPFLVWSRLVEWSLIPLAFVVLRFVPDHPTRLLEWLLLLLAGALFASPVVRASRREYLKTQEARSAADLAVDYQARLGLALGEVVTPVADLLGQIAAARGEQRAQLQGQLRQRVVDACAELCGPERTRACFFALEGNALRPVAWAGRVDAPTSVFLKGEPRGDRAHRLVERRHRLLVSDTRRPPRGVSVRPDATYRTFLSVAVYGGGPSLGMLAVDAPEPNSLNESDLDIATALALLLGAGLGRP